MKLLRYGPRGAEKPGILDAQGRIRDLSDQVPDISPSTISPDSLEGLRRIDPSTLPIVEGSPRLGVPLSSPGNFVAIGLNYADHAKEAGLAIPAEPIFFIKATSCLNGADDPVVLPQGSRKGDWEVELGVVIGQVARYVSTKSALDYLAGYVLVNDVSEREFQKEHGSQWAKGKGCETFGPVGPWLVTTDEIYNPQNLDMWLDVNGKRMQTGNTRTMIFGVAEVVSYVSRFVALQPGDLITTGTPPGVGEGRSPQVFLRSGDVIALGITGLGEQHQTVEAWRSLAVKDQ